MLVDTLPEEEDEMAIPKSMREIYNLSNANRRRTGKEKSSKPMLQLLGDDGIEKGVQKMKEDDIQGAESIIASRGGPGGYFGSSGSGKRQRTAPGKEGDIKLMMKMGWVKAEPFAAVPADSPQQATEKDSSKQGGGNHHHGGFPSTHCRKSSASSGRGGGGGGGGGGGSFDYYSGSGIGAFDPNAAPPKNPFFAGAATGAASMLHGGESKGKSHKRNKK